jgi:PAS domain S-box-containing protein
LSELADDIAYGITALRSRVAHAKAEEETRKAHLKTKNILQSITEAYIVFDRKGKFVELNRCAEDFLGRKAEELKDRTFWEIFPKVKEKEFDRQFRKAVFRNEEVHFEAFSRLTGRWFETHAYPFAEGLAVYLHDITSRKRSEELLHETRDYLENLINYANAPIIVWDPDFKITRFNHAFEFLSGYEAKDVIGKNLEMLFPQENKNESISKIERTLSGEHWESVEIPIRCQSGDVRTLLWNSANIYLPNTRKLSATIAQGQDITGRKFAEELLKKSRDELEQRVAQRTADLIKAQKELMAAKRLSDIGALSATVAHELRNPLGVIRAAAFNVRRKNQNPDLGKHLDRIDKKILESDQIINNLLFYSRIKSPNFERVTLPDILKEAAADAKNKYKGYDVTVKNNSRALKNAVIEADPAQLFELFSNILNNAYESFPDKKGMIEIKGVFDDRDGLAKISFNDNGCGIGEDILHKVQEPFFTTKSQGTGLGLAVCFQVARLHGGKIEVDSCKGKGSVFTVILPAKPEPKKAE